MACFEAEFIPLVFELATEKGARHESVGSVASCGVGSKLAFLDTAFLTQTAIKSPIPLHRAKIWCLSNPE